ncbi:hypothetical protein SRABI27_00395 [Pedobacter sp. Bi27]|nr:hypothetical protein SRABI126_00400 [Pedobacter sp. Bi126]CAH0145754.1 hypothetical protein SRABI27_00395 [Pedobacter sp. Bi27]CAH0213021.1 hypothetical protein SRABI36_02281 [Pedobacter sp. Bi36]
MGIVVIYFKIILFSFLVGVDLRDLGFNERLIL